MDAVEQAISMIDKKMASEIKNLKQPAVMIKEVLEYAARFLDGEGAQWNVVQAKLYDYVRRGTGTRDLVSEEQLETLRQFGRSELSPDKVKAKSFATSHLATYLLAMLELQEHLAAQPPHGFNTAQIDVGNGIA